MCARKILSIWPEFSQKKFAWLAAAPADGEISLYQPSTLLSCISEAYDTYNRTTDTETEQTADTTEDKLFDNRRVGLILFFAEAT